MNRQKMIAAKTAPTVADIAAAFETSHGSLPTREAVRSGLLSAPRELRELDLFAGFDDFDWDRAIVDAGATWALEAARLAAEMTAEWPAVDDDAVVDSRLR